MAANACQTGCCSASVRSIRAACLLAAALLATAAGLASAEPAISGRASVVDGDTIDIRGARLRLHGIDAPESSQLCTTHGGSRWRCGQRAALALDEYIAGRTVRCERRDVDRYGRIVAECFLGGQSLNRWLVQQGWAVAYRQYSTEYVVDEDRARRAGRNIWSGHFDMPSEHRRGRAVATEPQANAPAPSPGCTLKGNINRRGDRIYHAPGQADYDRTVINTADGERWFCSHEEAQAAGWRPAKR